MYFDGIIIIFCVCVCIVFLLTEHRKGHLSDILLLHTCHKHIEIGQYSQTDTNKNDEYLDFVLKRVNFYIMALKKVCN